MAVEETLWVLGELDFTFTGLGSLLKQIPRTEQSTDSAAGSSLTIGLVVATIFLLSLLCPGTLCADNRPIAITEYVHNVWQADEGLPQNSAQAIAQTPDGYLWIATQEGLVRFDGVRFQVFDGKSTPEINNSDFRTLFVGRDGSLWAGTFAGDLIRLKDGKFTPYTKHKELSGNYVSALYEDTASNLWVGTHGGGLYRLRKGQFDSYTTKDGLANNSVSSIADGGDGALWIGTDGGLSRFQSGKFVNLGSRQGVSNEIVHCVYRSRDGSIWVGTEGGLDRYRDGKFSTYNTKNGLPSDSIHVVYEDHDGQLWIGTSGGLSKLQNDIFDNYTVKDGLSDDAVQAIYEDPEGSIWIGTSEGGLNRLRKAKFITRGIHSGLSSNITWTVTEDRSGDIWVGTNGAGLNRFSNGRFTVYGTKEGLSGNTIGAVFPSADGSLWISTNGGVDRLKDGKIITYTAAQGLPASRESSGMAPSVLVKAIAQDRAGNLWFGTDGAGLCLFHDGRFTTFTTKDGLVSNMVMWLTAGNNGELWIGTTKGLSKFADNTFTNYTYHDGLASNEIISMYEDSDGALWIGTIGGLNRLKNGKFTTYKRGDGLFDDMAFDILEDSHMNLWMSCNRGIYRVAKKELNDFADGSAKSVTSISYGTADGMKSKECQGGVQPAGWKSHDGKLWFPTIQGVVVTDPNDTHMNSWIPPVHVEQLIAGPISVYSPQQVRLPAGDRSMEFRYTALSFLAPNKVGFRYKLDGFDKDWIDAGTRRVAYYTNMPPGDYQFTVIASNDDGVWNDTGASVSVHLAPHYYQAYWFYGLCALAVIVCGSSLYRARMKGLKKREKELVMRVNERTSELQQEIAERERVDIELGRAEEKYRGIFEGAIVGIFQTTPDGRYLSANPAMAHTYGFDSVEELIATHQDIGHQAYVNSGRREEFKRILEREGLVEGFEYETRRKDGGSIWLSENARAVRDSRGNILYYDGTAEDITQRKRAQADLEKEIVERKTAQLAAQAAELAAQNANRAKSAFLANMSHEIRTPMNGIMGMTELVLDSEITPEQRDNLNTVKMSADSLLVVINDILDFSKIEAGKLELENIGFGLRDNVAEALKSLSFRAQEKGLELLNSVDSNVPDGVIGDPGRLRQLLLNLIGNAIKFTESGEVMLKVCIETQTENDLWLHFAVSDTGVGIPTEKREAIFGAFSQADDSITRKFGGTGLGLAISSKLVEMMDGRIWLDSEPGHGSVFHFTAHLGIPKEFTPKPVPVNIDGLRDLPVLVVDDNATNRRLLVEVLSEWQMKPTAVDGGVSALRVLTEYESSGKSFRLILLDAQMPGMDGFTLAALVKQESRLAGITVMMLTSVGFLGDAARCREIGIAAYLTKPIRRMELLEAIRVTLGGASSSHEPVTLVTRHTLHQGHARLRILLVEDNAVNQMLAVRLLEKRGHAVTAVGNGKDALKELSSEIFDVVLMDVQMPVMDGFEATAAIRSGEQKTGAHVPIIAMTAHALRDDEQRCLTAGMDAYISKPINSMELYELVESAARKRTNAAAEPLKK